LFCQHLMKGPLLVLVIFCFFISFSFSRTTKIVRRPSSLTSSDIVNVNDVKFPSLKSRNTNSIENSESSFDFTYHNGKVCPRPILNPIYVTTGGRDSGIDQALQDFAAGYVGSPYGNIISQYVGNQMSIELGYTTVLSPPSSDFMLNNTWLSEVFENLPEIYIPVFLIPSPWMVNVSGEICCENSTCNLLGYHTYTYTYQPYIVVCYQYTWQAAAVFSHELAETITDVHITAWYATISGSIQEVADLCESLYIEDVVLNGTTYQLVQLWSNFDGMCTVNTSFVPTASTANFTTVYTPSMTFNGTTNPAPPINNNGTNGGGNSSSNPPGTCQYPGFICGSNNNLFHYNILMLLLFFLIVYLI